MSDQRLAAWLFAAVLATNLLCCSGTVRSADGGTMLEVTRSIVTEGSFAVPPGSVGRPGRDGRLYAQYGPGCSIAALPLFLVGHGLAWAAGLSAERRAQVEEFAVALFNPIVVAAIAVLVLLVAVEMGVSRRGAAAGGLLGAFGTGLFVQMKDFNSEPLTALLLLGAFYVLLRQRPYPLAPSLRGGGIEAEESRSSGGLRGGAGMALVGALAGAAILTRPANVLGAALLGVAVAALSVRRARGARVLTDLACFALPVLGCAGLYGLYNSLRFGNPLDTGYHEVTFTYPLLRGLWLQLFSLERGIVWYDPVVLLAPVGAVLLWRRQRGAVLLAGAMAAAFVLLYSAYAQAPAGGHSMGQRFLLVVMPLLVVLALPAMEGAGSGRGERSALARGVNPAPGSGADGPDSRRTRRSSGPCSLSVSSWTRGLVVTIIAVSVLVQLPLVWVNPSYYYARLSAEQEQSGAPGTGPAVGQTVLVRSWVLAVEVTRDALTRPEWVRSLPEHAEAGAAGAAMLPGPRSYHVPYFWWALAWAYGVPAAVVLAGVALNLASAILCILRLSCSPPPLPGEGAGGEAPA
jgi:hypothetical protein